MEKHTYLGAQNPEEIYDLSQFVEYIKFLKTLITSTVKEEMLSVADPNCFIVDEIKM